MIESIAAVVVLYNPSSEVIKNIESYISQVERIVLVDNSVKNNFFLFSSIISPKIIYYPLNKNEGIGKALNVGIKKSIELGSQYVLTMDQDSFASPHMVEDLYNIITESETVGIAACEHINPDFQTESISDITEEVLYTITSGNLIKLKIFQIVGDFCEDLFIDHVDHEFCLRLNSKGFKVLKTKKCFIYHKVGNTIPAKIFNIAVTPTNHPPVRLYYRTRNRLIVNRKYKKIFPAYIKEDTRNFIREFLGTVFFEHNVMSKITMMWQGYKDYRKNKLGEYVH